MQKIADSVFENPTDTIALADSIPFFLQKKALALQPDSGLQQFVFSKPYEVIATDSQNLFFRKDSAALVSTVERSDPGFAGKPLVQPSFWESVFFLLFALCFVLFSVVFRRGGQSLVGNFKHLLNFGSRNKWVYKEQITISEVWGELFLVFQALLIISMAAYIGMWNPTVGSEPPKWQLLLFLALFLSLTLFLVFKYGVYKIMGFVLPELGLGEWSEKYLRVIEVLGIFLFLPALFFIYLPQYRAATLIFIGILFFIGLVLVFVGLQGIFVKNKIGFLYFIVYLCGVEIAPFLVLYKGAVLLINYAGTIL